MEVELKEFAGKLDATPTKRLYQSIIADYDLNKAICELVDNAIDIWKIGGRKSDLRISVSLDPTQQTIVVTDDAGGIAEKDLAFVIAPGQSLNSPTAETIGIFGVGTKRAVVALAQDVKIQTRKGDDTYLVEFDDAWIRENDSWELLVYKVSEIPQGSTQIELLKLRKKITEITIAKLNYHLGATYAIFLKDKRLSILLNDQRVAPIVFEDWAYPPAFEPIVYSGKVATQDGQFVDVLATAGLTQTSNDASSEYGVYFYCNDRLIVRGLKTIDVGFGIGQSGKLGESISLARLIIQLHGQARYMPWNSSKSDINTSSEVFLSLHDWLVKVVKDFTSLSRRMRNLNGGWLENVFNHPKGEESEVEVSDFPSANMSYLPPLPESKPRFARVVQQVNRAVSEKKPWTTGLYEGIIAVDWILKQSFEQKNRIALILLDSTLEIAFKEYLANDCGTPYSDVRLESIFKDRTQVHSEIMKYVKISVVDWGKIKHFYNMRCQLIHRKASATISDKDIVQFRAVVERVLRKIYGLQFARSAT
jgi:anti-sigma regulatory factor (Ser/Thr protein kinase)